MRALFSRQGSGHAATPGIGHRSCAALSSPRLNRAGVVSVKRQQLICASSISAAQGAEEPRPSSRPLAAQQLEIIRRAQAEIQQAQAELQQRQESYLRNDKSPLREPARTEMGRETKSIVAKEPGAEQSKSPGRLSAAEQLEIIRRAQLESQKLLRTANVNTQPGADPSAPNQFRGHRNVDVRMYDQLTASRNRMSQNLSTAKKYISILEQGIEDRDNELVRLKVEFSSMLKEITTMVRMTEQVKASAEFSVDKQATVSAISKLVDRMDMLQQVTGGHLEALDSWVVREVPVVYNGIGAEVRIMGDFDNWTMGQQLSSDSFGESVYQTFSTTLRLVPGEYKVKFQVDGEWRTAGDWPTETDGEGNLQNVIVVV